MSRYDGLIIPRSYSEYINKTDAATLQQALQLSGVLSGAVASGDNKAVTSGAVNSALQDLNNIKWQVGDVWTGINTDVCDSSNLYNIKIQQGNRIMYQLTGWIRVKSGTYAANTKVFELPHKIVINTFLFGASSGIVKPNFYQLYVENNSKDVIFQREVHFETLEYIQFNTFICTEGA